jgi:5-hydroxyisourate hydrolase
MSGITTHVLDTARGVPASGIGVRLEIHLPDRGWVTLAERATDADGRVRDFVPAGSALDAGLYRLTFATGAYQRGHGVQPFHPEVPVVFEVRDGAQHHHVPLLLSPFGYVTYRGS